MTQHLREARGVSPAG